MNPKRLSRKKHRKIGSWPLEARSPELVASEARYAGSAEHKDYLSPAGNPALRSDAARCDPSVGDFTRLTQVLREAIRRRCTSSVFEGGFPKYAWGWIGDKLYEARHINGPLGRYKGYPLEYVEHPIDGDGLLEQARRA